MIATPNIPQISGLSFEAQDKILDNSKLLYGFVLNEDGPVTSTHRVAQFKDPASQTLLYSPEETSGEIEVFSTQSKPDLAYIRKGWSERAAMSRQSATLVTPGEHRIPTMDKMDAHALHLFGRFQVPCATFHIEPEDLMPSESFRRAVAAALLQPNETAKFHELQNTLSKFGHVLATRLEMGLSLCTTRKIPFKSIEDQILQEGEMKVQFLELLHSAVKNPSASTEKINVYTRGGNPGVLPGLDIISWLSTVQDPTNWMVIGVSSVVPTISILDEPLRSSVQALIASAHSMQLLQPPPIFHLPHRFTQRYELLLVCCTFFEMTPILGARGRNPWGSWRHL
ncbi:hypothetical protein BOTBODRAFT_599990 [Botryobasidium botryosum FD-172 SS1]|uniref:MACPF-like domain-containing protein n=1 Tax=Botryobasidium botryosum (strain FD-172 SS1) TaxID=930990 RepID=A0A067MR59_BOTB1|nr:hypothetical protein BOTBODRAFT_599990 [Botryobasidium botryosum FD-172 SS1]